MVEHSSYYGNCWKFIFKMGKTHFFTGYLIWFGFLHLKSDITCETATKYCCHGHLKDPVIY